ncbi:hypothetical protein MKX03_028228, partial [Papaver bracteatum]
FCHRLGHEHQDCIEVFLLNHQHMFPQAPAPIPLQPNLQALGPFIELEYDDDYFEDMIHNVDFEDPDPDWSDWGSNPFGSPTSSDQKKSAISFFDGEGYQQEGFHYDSSSDSARTISEAWLVESNNFFEDPISELVSLPPSQPADLQKPFSPSIFLVSDIEDSELISYTDLRSLDIKRFNPEQQSFLNSSGIGSSLGLEITRLVTNEDYEQWTSVSQPTKRFKPDTTDQSVFTPFISSIICTFNTTSIEEGSTQPVTQDPPAANK